MADDTLPAPKDLSGVPDLTVTNRDPKEKVAEAIERTWREVWIPILIANEETQEWVLDEDPSPDKDIEGVLRWALNIDQLKLELHDAYTLYSSLNLLYWELTGGMISKPYTHASHVIDAAREHYSGWAASDIVDELEAKIDADDEDKSPEFYEGIAVAIDIIKSAYPQGFER